MTPEAAGEDFDYIIRIIQFLDLHHGIRFFISSKDFDILYRWWEKRIPAAVIRESLDRVVERSRFAEKTPSHAFRFSAMRCARTTSRSWT